MKMRASSCYLLVALTLLKAGCIYAQTGTASDQRHAAQGAMDRDLLEVTIPQLGTALPQPQIHRYRSRALVHGAHREVQRDLSRGAEPGCARSSRHRRARGRGSQSRWRGFVRGPLWGVPIVIKANTSIKGLITTDGWKGYIDPWP